IGADCVKTGMLNSAPVVEAVCDVLEARIPRVPLVVDPVMVAKGGHPLLDPDAIGAVRTRLIPRATVPTPDLPDAELLTGIDIRDEDAMRQAAELLLSFGPRAVLLKGGHLEGRDVVDLLIGEDGIEALRGPRVESRHTHGTGCTLASAIACGLAQGLSL